jgi:hypothetical protein
MPGTRPGSRAQRPGDQPVPMTDRPHVEDPPQSPAPGRGPVVVAHTTGDDRYPAVRLAAVRHAREHGCTVILYDAEAASAFSDPMPNQWASEGEADDLGDRLGLRQLELLGREPLATQVREARAGGVDAFGWLPKDHGPRPLADYAISQAAHRVFVPEELEQVGELGALLQRGSGAAEKLPGPGIDLELVPAAPSDH